MQNPFYALPIRLLPGLGVAACRELFCSSDPYQLLVNKQFLPGGHGLSEVEATAFNQLQAKGEAHPAWQRALREWDWLQHNNGRVLVLGSHDYPALLRQLPDPPPLLYVQGKVDCLNDPQVALVGSRAASIMGRENAANIAMQLARSGITVCSGMALGIDTAAHQGALAGGGNTVAVVGTGLDVVYPQANQALAGAIREHGLLISEQPLGSPPLAGHFPSRNRIIAGLSLATVVVEAALRSGSLITARLALDYNREVFALPGSIRDQRAKGCHLLIKQGAQLIDGVEDILLALGQPLQQHLQQVSTAVDLPPEQERLLQHLGFEPTDLDTIARRSGLSMAQLLPLLLELELGGQVEQVAGSYCRLAS